VVREFVRRQVGRTLSRRRCRNDLYRLGFVFKRPQQRLRGAAAARRAAFVREDAVRRAAAKRTGAPIFFADEAHCSADADLRGTWVRKGEPALVDSTSPRGGEQARSDAAVCVATGAVEVMEWDGNRTAETAVAFRRQRRAHHPGPLIVIGDHGPGHGGEPLRAYLTTPDLRLPLVRLPAARPDRGADEAIGGGVREEVSANTCGGTAATVREAVDTCLRTLPDRAAEVTRRCRTVLQEHADAFATEATALLQDPQHGDLTLALV
jgi:hypothetical protein